MSKIIVSLHILTLWAANLSAAEKIEFSGVRNKIEIDNEINLTIAEHSNKWQNKANFTKLSITEYNQTKNQTRRQIASNVNNSLNQFMLAKYQTIAGSDDLVLVKALVADSEFLRLLKVMGNNSSSAVVELSLPTQFADSNQKNIMSLLDSITWEATNLLIINENPRIHIGQPEGFRITQKYVNSLVLKTTEDNIYDLDANLVFSIIAEDVPESALVEKTKRVLSESKTLEKFKIIQLTERTSVNGPIIVARASGRYEANQVEIDISHFTLKLGKHLLIAQLITARNVESFLKLEDVLNQVLSSLEHQKLKK